MPASHNVGLSLKYVGLEIRDCPTSGHPVPKSKLRSPYLKACVDTAIELRPSHTGCSLDPNSADSGIGNCRQDPSAETTHGCAT